MTRDEVYQDIERTLGSVPEFFTHLPDATIEHDWKVFKAFQLGETEIPRKYKELIGLAVAAAIQCPYMQFYHKETAVYLGASDEELDEAARIALQTSGWSSFVTAIGESIDQFKLEVLTALDHRHGEEQEKKKAA